MLVPSRSGWYKVFGFLGQSTNNTKKAFVEKLVSVIASEEPPSISSLKKLSENECRKIHSKFETLGFRPFNCFLPACWPEGAQWPLPGGKLCCYFMFIDAGLLCAGALGEKKSMNDEFRRFIEENILVYAVAINSWLKEIPSKHVTPIITPRYITKDNALEIIERVHSSLGEKDKAKEWLTACLLKTIKDNQRHGKRTELIDDFPETTSWFRRVIRVSNHC